MENYKEEINALITRLNELETKINEPQFEVGKWYCEKYNPEIMGFYNENGWNNFGFNYKGWSDSIIMINTKYWRLSTESEITEALTKEAIKRGLVIGNYALFGANKVKRLISSSDYKWNYFGFAVGNDLLMDSNGIWAEVYKPKTIDEWGDEYFKQYYEQGDSVKDFFKKFITKNNFKLPE